MIAKLTGRLDSSGDGWAIVDVGGVGYLVSCSGRTLARLAVGADVRLVVETHVREGAIQLFGFAEIVERDWFRLLTAVQGVGAKAALSILGSCAPEELMAAVVAGDRAMIMRAPGIGQKLASRIVNELKDKVGAIDSAGAVATAAGRQGGLDRAAADAVSALVNLGFRPADAFGAVSAASRRLGGDADVDVLIRSGLAELAPRETSP